MAIAIAVATLACGTGAVCADSPPAVGVALTDSAGPGEPSQAEAAVVMPPLSPGAPDLEALRKASRRGTAVVWRAGRRYELPAARFDSTGIWSAHSATYRVPRVAIIQSPDAVRRMPPPRPIPWNTIDSIAVASRASGSTTGFIVASGLALVIGLPVAAISLVTSATHTGGTTQGTALAIAVPVVAAGVLTASLLSLRDRYRIVYRAR